MTGDADALPVAAPFRRMLQRIGDGGGAILDEAAKLPATNPWLSAALSGGSIVTKRVTPITTADWPTPARRPADSRLDCSKLARVFGVALPDWQPSLARTVDAIIAGS